MAAFHYNENSERLQAVTKEGKPCYSIRFPNHKKGEYSVRKEKIAATCGHYYDVKCMQSEVQEEKKTPSFFWAGYTKTLLTVLVREYEEDQTSLKNSIEDLRENMPPPLTASFEKPCKETAVEQLVTRFAQ